MRHWHAVQPARSKVVQSDGRDIGLLVVVREPSHIRLQQIFIQGDFQRRGIGTAILRALKDEAREASLPIRLRVLASNPARHLYEREGFVVTERTSEYTYMEWRPL